MAKVKVHNDNVHPHKEMFKGIEVVIPAKSFIEMDFEEACELKGQFTPIVYISEGNPDARFYKMLRVEWPKPEMTKIEYRNPVTGARYDTAAQLAASLTEFDHLRVRDEDAERELRTGTTPSTEVAELRAELQELKDLIRAQVPAEKKGPGRPKKVVNE